MYCQLFRCNHEFEIKIFILDTRKHKNHIRHAKNRQRGKLPKPILKKTNFNIEMHTFPPWINLHNALGS